MILDKLYQSVSVTVGLVMEIKTVPCLLDSNSLLMSFMTQYELLEVKESAFVMNSLSDLNLTSPGVRSPGLFTVIALLIINYKFNSESLLQHSVVLDLLLNYHFHFYSSAMGFCPDENCVDYFHFV